MKLSTGLKAGSLVRLSSDLQNLDMFGKAIWSSDMHFLKDPESRQVLSNVCIHPEDLCIVIQTDRDSLLIITPRGSTGWIKKTKMEVVK